MEDLDDQTSRLSLVDTDVLESKYANPYVFFFLLCLALNGRLQIFTRDSANSHMNE